MTDFLSRPCAAFAGMRLIVHGPLADVALAVKAMGQGDADRRLRRGGRRGRRFRPARRRDGGHATADRAGGGRSGRPAAGHGGRAAEAGPRPSEAGRRRARGDAACRAIGSGWRSSPAARRRPCGAWSIRRAACDGDRTEKRARRDSAYAFMAALAGDMPGFEEATRALFASDRTRFAECIAPWPEDVRRYALRLAFGEPD